MKIFPVTLLFLCSCSLFTTDTTPAVKLKQDQTKIFLEVSENFAEIINNATGITQAQKALILSKIRTAADEYEVMDIALIDFLNSVDDQNREVIFLEIKELFSKLRSKLNGQME